MRFKYNENYFYVILKFLITKKEHAMSKSFTSLSLPLSPFFPTRTKKHNSLKFAESAQEISTLLVAYILKKARIINTTQLKVKSVIYPVNMNNQHIFQDAGAWVITDGTNSKEPNLLEILYSDKNKVILYTFNLLNSVQKHNQMKTMHRYMQNKKSNLSSMKKTEEYRKGDIWYAEPQDSLSRQAITWFDRKHYKASTQTVTYQNGDFTALYIQDEQEKTKEKTKEKVLTAIDMLKLLKDLCEKKLSDGENISQNDINEFRRRRASIGAELNQKLCGKKSDLREINKKLENLIDSIAAENDSKKDANEGKDCEEKSSEEKSPEDDADIRKRLNQLFLEKILELMPKINMTGQILEEHEPLLEATLSILQESNLLDLGKSNIEFKTKVIKALEQVKHNYYSGNLTDFINESTHEKQAIPDLERLKLARDQFYKKIMQLMIEEINLISSDYSDYIEILFTALNEYNSLINELDSAKNSEKSKAADKTHYDDFGAGGYSGAGAGAKGKGPDFTENEQKALELAEKYAVKPKNQEAFLSGIQNKFQLLLPLIKSLTKENKENRDEQAGVIFGLSLELQRLTEENQRLRSKALDVPVAMAMEVQPSAPPAPNNATPFKEEAGKSEKEGPRMNESDGPS